jgi:2'-5' RNA ligase
VSAAARFAAFQRDRFRELGRVRPSIVTDWPAAWAPDRRYLLFLAPVGHHPSVRSAAARALAPVATLGVPALDARRLHVTIQAVGYLDALPAAADRSSIPQALEALEGCRAIDLGIVGAGSFDDAAVLWLDPWEPVAAIRDRLLDGVSALAPARGDRARPPEEGGFAPHISIAYYDRAVDTGPIADALDAVELGSVRFTIDALELVSVPPPAGARIAWDVLATFPLRPLDAARS